MYNNFSPAAFSSTVIFDANSSFPLDETMHDMLSSFGRCYVLRQHSKSEGRHCRDWQASLYHGSCSLIVRYQSRHFLFGHFVFLHLRNQYGRFASTFNKHRHNRFSQVNRTQRQHFYYSSKWVSVFFRWQFLINRLTGMGDHWLKNYRSLYPMRLLLEICW